MGGRRAFPYVLRTVGCVGVGLVTLRRQEVQGVIDRLAERFDLTIEMEEAAREAVTFKLPRVLSEAESA